MDISTADRMKVSWKRAREHYQTFFALLDEVRREVGDDKLSMWCYYNLGFGLDRILQISTVLTKDTENSVKQSLAAAREFERQAKAQDRDAKDAARRARELAEADHQLEMARKRRVKAEEADRTGIRVRPTAKRQPKELQAARQAAAKPAPVNTTKPRPEPANTTNAAKKPRSADRHLAPNRDRHSPNYMRDYMRRRRAEQRQKAP
jgi:hypothetical protein